MSRYNFEAEREKNRRKSLAGNDPLAFVRDNAPGLTLQQQAAQQLKLAETNHKLHEEALREKEAALRKKQEEANTFFEPDDPEVAKWRERRRKSLAAGDESSSSNISQHLALILTKSDASNNSDSNNSINEPAIPEEQEPGAPVLSSLNDNQRPQQQFGFDPAVVEDVHASLSISSPGHARFGRRFSSFTPPTSNKGEFHAKLSSISFHHEYPQQLQPRFNKKQIGSSSINSAKDSGFGDEPFV